MAAQSIHHANFLVVRTRGGPALPGPPSVRLQKFLTAKATQKSVKPHKAIVHLKIKESSIKKDTKEDQILTEIL